MICNRSGESITVLLERSAHIVYAGNFYTMSTEERPERDLDDLLPLADDVRPGFELEEQLHRSQSMAGPEQIIRRQIVIPHAPAPSV